MASWWGLVSGSVSESELNFELKSGLSWVCVNVGVGVRVVVWVMVGVGLRL